MIENSQHRTLLAFTLAIAIHLVPLSLIRLPSVPERQPHLQITVRTRATAVTIGEESQENSDEAPVENSPQPQAGTVRPAEVAPESAQLATGPERTHAVDGEVVAPPARPEETVLQPVSAAPVPDAADTLQAEDRARSDIGAPLAPDTADTSTNPLPHTASSSLPIDVFEEIPTRRAPPPVYPERARGDGQQGVVELELSIDARGGVTAIAIVSSSGYPLLDEAAISAVERWRFERGDDRRRTRRRFVFRLESQ